MDVDTILARGDRLVVATSVKMERELADLQNNLGDQMNWVVRSF